MPLVMRALDAVVRKTGPYRPPHLSRHFAGSWLRHSSSPRFAVQPVMLEHRPAAIVEWPSARKPPESQRPCARKVSFDQLNGKARARPAPGWGGNTATGELLQRSPKTDPFDHVADRGADNAGAFVQVPHGRRAPSALALDTTTPRRISCWIASRGRPRRGARQIAVQAHLLRWYGVNFTGPADSPETRALLQGNSDQQGLPSGVSAGATGESVQFRR